MVHRDAQEVAGHAGVFAAVLRLSNVDLQGPVVMQDVRVSIQGTGAAVLKPGTQGENSG